MLSARTIPSGLRGEPRRCHKMDSDVGGLVVTISDEESVALHEPWCGLCSSVVHLGCALRNSGDVFKSYIDRPKSAARNVFD